MFTPSSYFEKAPAWFLLFGLSFVLFGCFVFLLALGDIFFFPLLVAGGLFFGSIASYSLFRFLRLVSTDFKIALLIALLATFVIHTVTVPTIFSGRDQGSLSEAAIRLSQNGKLAFSNPASEAFFQLYGPGSALNFPGFAYTTGGNLITQFPLGYISWLASFVSFFGINGLIIANGILFFLFLTTFYALLRLFGHSYYAFFGLFIALFSFLPTWFTKFTLSENLAVFLFVFLVYSLLLFLQEKKIVSYISILVSGSLLAFTRIEGFAFLVITLLILCFLEPTRALWKKHPFLSLLLPGALFLLVFLRDFFVSLPYYKMIGKALLKYLAQLGSGNITGDLVQAGSVFSLGSIFLLYGLLFLFIIGTLGMLLFIKGKYARALLPALIALPTVIYFIDPNISLDHPWMLRRFLFSLFPAILFSAIIGIGLFFSKERTLPLEKPMGLRLFFASFLFIGLILVELPAWSSTIRFAEHAGLEKQIADFSREFSSSDLVLVDRGVTGDGFAMLSGPSQYLFEKNMVYFFNPADVEKLPTDSFSRVFLLIPITEYEHYASVLNDTTPVVKTVTFATKHFERISLENSSDQTLHLPEKITSRTQNYLFQIK